MILGVFSADLHLRIELNRRRSSGICVEENLNEMFAAAI